MWCGNHVKKIGRTDRAHALGGMTLRLKTVCSWFFSLPAILFKGESVVTHRD